MTAVVADTVRVEAKLPEIVRVEAALLAIPVPPYAGSQNRAIPSTSSDSSHCGNISANKFCGSDGSGQHGIGNFESSDGGRDRTGSGSSDIAS